MQFFAFVSLFCMSCGSADADQRRRIYFLESLSPTLPAAVRTIDAFKQRLSERTTENFDIFVDYMELVRLPSQGHIDRTVQYLSGKYAEAPPDVLITLGRAALPFMAKYRDVIAPNVPIILTSVPSKDAEASDLRNAFWVSTEYSFSKTLDLAARLQPKAHDLVIVGGAGNYDQRWLDYVRRELQAYSERYSIKYIAGLSYDETLLEVSRLPKDAIVMMSFFFADGSGLPRVSPEVAASVAKVSPAPVYSPISTNLGTGIVGGYMDSWEQEGAAAADIAFEILSGKPPDAIPHQNVPLHTYHIDERQLRRWHLSSSRLPLGSDVHFRQFRLLEQYYWQTISVIAVLLTQAGAISGLVFERRRRRMVELELRRRLLEVIHLNRTAVAGPLSLSIAHELNQPLGAILSYAEAAMIHLKADPPNLARVEQILGSIIRDDNRAAQVVSHLRTLLRAPRKIAASPDLCEFDA